MKERQTGRAWSQEKEQVEVLVKKVQSWAEERNLHTANPKDQFLKVVEELGEMVKALVDWDEKNIVDGIGDTLVTLIILLQQLGEDWEVPEELGGAVAKPSDLLMGIGKISEALAKGRDATEIIKQFAVGILEISEGLRYKGWTALLSLSTAYDEIKNRKGKMVDGVFVKECDLQEVDK